MSIDHTPGPWIAEGATVKAVSHGRWFKITRADGLRHTPAGNAANATLIAAAPDLLEALKAIAGLARGCDDVIERVAQDAIAKATGGAS